jgi:3-hydroxyisobutyrate dehydrogenase
MERIAVLGLGIMGGGMAVNWLRKGYPTVVYNRTRAKAEALIGEGAIIAATPAEAARDADFIISMVAEDNASREVWLGRDGALAVAKPGAILIESSTLTPDWVRELASAAAAKGCGFLDAPVTGSKQAAEEGQLTFLVGGDTADVEKARPILAAVSRGLHHLGPIAAGSTWKLINNMLVSVQVSALAEAMALAAKAGVDPKVAATLIEGSAFFSGSVKMKLPRMIEHRYDSPDFMLSLMLKDTRYVTAMARKLGLDLKLAPAAAELYGAAEKERLGDCDFAAVVEAVGKQ